MMQAMTEYDAYKMYLALKAHFQTEKYNVIEQRGRIKSSYKNFQGSGKSFELRRLVNTYKDAEICDFMVANFTAGDRWGGVFDSNATREYQNWKRRVESLRYIFTQDMEKLQSMADDEAVDLTHAEAGQHPLVVRAYYGRHIALETLVILDSLLAFSTEYDTKLRNTLMWPETSLLIKKYRPFLKFDEQVFKGIYENYFGRTA